MLRHNDFKNRNSPNKHLCDGQHGTCLPQLRNRRGPNRKQSPDCEFRNAGDDYGDIQRVHVCRILQESANALEKIVEVVPNMHHDSEFHPGLRPYLQAHSSETHSNNPVHPQPIAGNPNVSRLLPLGARAGVVPCFDEIKSGDLGQ